MQVRRSCVFALLSLFAFAALMNAATITVSPQSQLRDAKLSELRITGLAPHQSITLRATTNDLPGGQWRSESQFVADANGAIDVAAVQPVSGAYRAKDVMGPIWSMSTADAFTQTIMLIGGWTMGNYAIALEVLDSNGTPIAQTQIHRLSSSAANPIASELWSPLGYEMKLFYPANKPAKQTVVHITGSGGGRLEGFCEMLAAHGYFAACVPYFGVPGTPATLREVPLELFSGAIDQVLQHPRAVGTEVVFSGVSRGGEGALLVSATFPERVKATLAFVPTAHMWESEDMPPTASWTLNGQHLPFLKIDWDHVAKFNSTYPWTFTPTFRYSVARSTPEEREAARIPVEKIDGPVFMATGQQDLLGPCDEWADQVEATLTTAKHPHKVVHVKSPQAGHLVFNVPYTPISTTVALIYECGGTTDGTVRGEEAMWPELLKFLAELP